MALPLIQMDFQTNLTGIQWVMNAYTLALAVLLLTSGSLGDRYGRKRIFMIGILVCSLASLFSGFSQNITQLIAFQVVLGIGASMMIPGSLAIINASFSEKERGQAIGLWSGFSAGIMTLGPFLGGLLIENFGWEAIFWINIPVGISAFLATHFFVPESHNPEAGHIDWKGTLWISLGLFGTSYGLIDAPVSGWNSLMVWGSLLGGSLAFALFVRTELHSDSPMIPMAIFRNPLVSGANLMAFFLYFALSGMIFFLILNFQQFQDYSPFATGASLLPSMAIIAFGSGPSGALSDKIGPRGPMILGPILVAVGMGSMALSDLESNFFYAFLPGLLLFGSGMALVVPPLTKSALTVESKFSGVASGINNAATRVAALMSIAILGALMIFLFRFHLESGLQNSALSVEQQFHIFQQAPKLGEITIPENFPLALQEETEQLIHSAFLFAFRWVMVINASLALLSAVLSFWLIRNPQSKHDP